MKTCPRCGAVAFDDADVCYGCLYRFTSQEMSDAGMQEQQGLPMAEDVQNRQEASWHERSMPAQNTFASNTPKPNMQDRSMHEQNVPDPKWPEQSTSEHDAPVPLKTQAYPLCDPSLHMTTHQEPPEFSIHLKPRCDQWGGWKWDCSVEIEEKARHEVVGRHALKVH